MNPHALIDPADPIAVVGMAGRFPGAPDTDSLWNLMMGRREAIRPVPPDRWDSTVQLDPQLRIPAVGGFLDDIDLFDAGFFGVSPREAAAMDPQQRLLLEVGWRALEDAGQRTSDLAGSRTGVYVATVWHDYELLRKARGARHTSHTLVGTGRDILANRLSYFMKLRGPSLAVDTGCSSALVGLDLAARALRQGDIEAAIVGSTNLMMDPHVTVGLTHFGGLSPDGRCASFAKSANGFVRGEGVVAVYLKTLSRALQDGDRVHGLLVSTLTNNDGGGHSIVSPSQEGQEDLLRRTYRDALLPAAALSYVEAHGTGTKRGDPTEAGALGAVLGRARPIGDPLPIGSIKTNIGHLEGSSGLAGLVKVLLSLRHRVVPPTLHAEELNPDIPFDELNLSVVREPLALPTEGPVYLGVNSFGWGGTNAHIVVASPPPAAADAPRPRPVSDTGLPAVVTLSAQRAPLIARRAAQLSDELAATEADITEVAGALALRRDHFADRAAFVADDARELRTGLDALSGSGPGIEGAEMAGVATGRAIPRGKTAFVFPGQGSQWRDMGRELYRDSGLFASVVDRCAKALAPQTDWDLVDIFAGDGAGGEAGSTIAETWTRRTDVLQPALWAMSLGLAELWKESGVTPDVVLGTSQGEITAATFSGVLSYDDAALILARRGTLIANRVSGRGLMLAVDLDRQAATEAMEGFEGLVSFAAHNGPNSSVLSGEKEYILALKELLEADGTYCGLVNIDYASHSAGMQELRDDLMSALAPVKPVAGTIPVMSTVHARLVEGIELDADYWVQNLCKPIEFVTSMAELFDGGVTHVVEISPHPVIAPSLEQLAAARTGTPAVLTTLRRQQGGVRDFAKALARGYTTGLEPFGGLPRDSRFRVPGYPLERESFWPAEGSRRTDGASRGFEAPLAPAPGRPGVWQGALELSLDDQPWLGDHKLYDTAVLPGAGMLVLALNTALARTGEVPGRLSEIAFRKEVTLGQKAVRFTTEWQDAPAGGGDVRLLSLSEGAAEWDVIATARADQGEGSLPAPEFPEWVTGLASADLEAFYSRCTELGQVYGPAFQGVRSLYRHASRAEALGEVRLGEKLRAGNRPGILHTALWDAALQVGLALNDGREALMPTAVRTVTLLGTSPEPVESLWAHVLRNEDGTLDVRLFDTGRRALLVMEGLVLRPLPSGDGRDTDADRLHRIRWTEATAEAVVAPAPGRWIVCGGTDIMAQALADALTATGAEVRHLGADACTAEPLADVSDATGVVFVAPRYSAGPDAQQRGLSHLTAIIRSCSGLATLPRLTVVTDRAQLAGGDETPDPGAALYWGYGRVAQREHPELEPRLIDVDASDPDWAEACAAAIVPAGGADQLALRHGRLLAARITRGADDDASGALPRWRAGKQPFRVGAARHGGRTAVEFLPLARRAPGRGEVEIEVAAGVLSPADLREPGAGGALRLGRECVGRVTAVGPEVSAPRVGDRVVAVVPGALAGHVLAPAAHVLRVPLPLPDAEAAALSLPTATAWYALTERGGLAPKETVLIHSPSLPDCLAAVQVALIQGARPFVATAMGPEQSELLRGAGAELVLDTGDAGWPAAVREATDGRGADVVLGPQAGPAAAQAWELLAEDGRFIENADAAGAATAPALNRKTLRKGISFSSVDLDGLRERKPETFAGLLAAVWGLAAEGRLTPLPVQTYDCSASAGTTADLTHDHDRARLVLTGLQGVDHVAPEPLPGGRFRADGSYLISGGLGALGLSLAEFLAAHGAGTLVLVGRSAPGTEAVERIAALREQGTGVETLRCDITDRAALRQALEDLRDGGLPPLRGVVHAAGVVADATITNATPRQIAKVLQPKVEGVRNLDAVTAQDPMDLFVMFSSAATLVGNPGQAAYSAANAYLDAFAESRRMRGLPALSVQWGPFAGIGLAAKDAQAGARLGERGLESFSTEEAWTALVRLLGQDRPVVGYVPVDTRRWFDAYPGTVSLSAWSELYAALKEDGAAVTGTAFLAAVLQTAQEDRAGLVEAKVRELAARVLRLAPERLERDVLFDSLGLDSLMSLELRNRLEAAFGLRLSPTLLWTYGTLQALSGALLAQITPTDGAR